MNKSIPIRIPHLIAAGITAACILFLALYQRGWIVAKDDYIQVRKVPLAENGIAIPGASDFCYIIEAGRYPYNSTFRVQWDSYEAKTITILPASDSNPCRIHFDNGYQVAASVSGPGDLSAAEWEMRSTPESDKKY